MKKKTPKRIITDSPFKIISLRRLSELSKIEYMAIYNTVTNRYNGLNNNQRTILSNLLYDEVKDVFEYLGFEMKLTRIKKEEV